MSRSGVVHQVGFRWKDGVTKEQIDAVEAGLGQLAEKLATWDGVLTYGFGRDLGLAEGNADFGVLGIFADEATYQAYATDEFHVHLITTVIRPLIGERTALQFQMG